MNRLNPSELLQFARKYRFPGGRIRRLAIQHRKGEAVLLASLSVRTADGNPVKLKLRLERVEEYRFQKRPSMGSGRISEFRMSYLQGRIFLTFDSLGLSPGEVPGIHDFRASEAFAAGDVLFWEDVKAGNETGGASPPRS
jgi:hypothetical protein